MIMSTARFTEEFKLEAVKQVTEQQRPVAEVAGRLGVSTHSIYAWVKRYSKSEHQRDQDDVQTAELKRLRAEVNRLTEERDILKKAAAYFAKQSG
jgi:transposase|tara:strand:+ start:14055 stop:14339 length:285 start_codon:yes stop_codon:yes gene_type:complete